MARITQADIDIVINACQIKIDTLTDEAASLYARRKNHDSEIAQVTHLRKLIVNLQNEEALEDNPLEIIYYEAIDKSGLLDLPIESTTLTLDNSAIGRLIFITNPAEDDFWKKTGTTVISNPILQGVPHFTGNVNIGNDITFTPTEAASVLDTILVRNSVTKEIEIRDASTLGGSHTIGSHSDVTITTIADGELIRWNGSIWINNTLTEAGVAALAHTHPWSDIVSGKPTTLIGYGITNAYTKTEVDAIVALYELDLGNPSANGYVLSSTTGGTRSWVAQTAAYTDVDARNAISSSATGLDYAPSTGIFTITSGYIIPTLTMTGEWDAAYSWGDHALAGYSLDGHLFSSHPDVDVSSQSNNDLLYRASNLWSDTNGLLTFDGSDLSVNNGLILNSGQTITWNSDFKTLNIPTGTGSTLQIGQELYVLIYNDTGVQINNGQVLHKSGAFTVGAEEIPTVILAKADSHETCDNTLLIATSDIANASVGMATISGRAGGLNTGGLTAGDLLYLSASTSGAFTSTRPSFPDYIIVLGTVIEAHATTGVMGFDVTRTAKDTILSAWDGGFREPMDLLVSSNGVTVIGTLQRTGTGDLTMIFSDGLSILDTTPADTVTLTPGTDTVPVENFIYVPQSTKTLTASTSDWPATEHIKVANVFIQSAAYVATNESLVNRNWNDHLKDTNGHLLHISEKLRQFEAQWDSGCEGAMVIDPVSTPDNVFLTVTAGKVYQLHQQTFDAFDTEVSDHFHVVNHFTLPYDEQSNLNTQTDDALGVNMNNSSFSFVMWGVANKTGEPDNLMINLPIGQYAFNFPEQAEADALNYSVYDIPKPFGGAGFLIARFTVTYKNNVWTLISTEDLRGKIPNASAGGSAGGSGASSWLGLTDTPSAYTGEANKFPSVNAGETALELVNIAVVDITDITATAAELNLLDISAEAPTAGWILSADSAIAASWKAPTSGSTPLTTKGDIFTYTTIDARLPVSGNDGWVLAEDSSTATGLKWAALPGGGDMLLGTTQIVTELKTFLDTKFALRNVANTFSGFFINTNTADRIYTLQDSAGTLAFTTDIIAEVNDLSSAVTWANIPIANVPTGTSGSTVALGDHTHTGVYDLYTSWSVQGDSGSGAVTTGETVDIAGGTGITTAYSVPNLTIDLDNTAVTNGSYTNTDLTVDAQGRITSASNGSAGGTISGTVAGTGRIAYSNGTDIIASSSQFYYTAAAAQLYNISSETGLVSFSLQNNNAITGGAAQIITAADASSGDAYISWNLTTDVRSYSLGIDNSDLEKLKLTTAATAVDPSSGTTLLDITTAGLFTFNSNVGGGGASNFLRADGTWSAPSGSGGTVTAVTGGTAITSTGGTTPQLSLDNTAVTPAAYTNADITVDAQGRITAAASGSAGSVTGTGTATRLAYWSGSSVITSDVNLYWDATNERLAIGTPTPSYPLDIRTNSNITSNTIGLYNSGTQGTAIKMTNAGATSGFTLTQASSGVVTIQNIENAEMGFFTNNVERLVIPAAGIGAGGSDPVLTWDSTSHEIGWVTQASLAFDDTNVAYINVAENITAAWDFESNIRLFDNVAVNFGTSIDAQIWYDTTDNTLVFNDTGATAGTDFVFETAGTVRFRFDMDAFTGTATDWINTSDKRLKENFKPYGSVLDKISDIKGGLTHFNWKEGSKKDVGFLAQDLQSYFPEFVTEDKKGILSISYGKLSTVAIEGVAELKEEVDELKKQIEELKRLIKWH